VCTLQPLSLTELASRGGALLDGQAEDSGGGHPGGNAVGAAGFQLPPSAWQTTGTAQDCGNCWDGLLEQQIENAKPALRQQGISIRMNLAPV